MTADEEIEQLKMEARMLLVVDDWRGLEAVLDQLNPLFLLRPKTGCEFYRELVQYNKARRKLGELMEWEG